MRTIEGVRNHYRVSMTEAQRICIYSESSEIRHLVSSHEHWWSDSAFYICPFEEEREPTPDTVASLALVGLNDTSAEEMTAASRYGGGDVSMAAKRILDLYLGGRTLDRSLRDRSLARLSARLAYPDRHCYLARCLTPSTDCERFEVVIEATTPGGAATDLLEYFMEVSGAIERNAEFEIWLEGPEADEDYDRFHEMPCGVSRRYPWIIDVWCTRDSVRGEASAERQCGDPR